MKLKHLSLRLQVSDTLVVSGCEGGKVKVWDIEQASLLKVIFAAEREDSHFEVGVGDNRFEDGRIGPFDKFRCCVDSSKWGNV